MFLRILLVLLALTVLVVSAAEVNLVVVDTKDKPISSVEVAFRPVTGGMYGELMKPGKTDKDGQIELKIGPVSEEVDFMLYFEGMIDNINEGLAVHAKGGNSVVKVEKSSKGFKLLTK